MSKLDRRALLLALTALGVASATPAAGQTASLDLSAGRAIGEAYRAAHPELDVRSLPQSLLPNGFDAEAATRLKSLAADDFHAGRIFKHQGWMLSQTEAQLFLLLAVT